MKETIYTMLKGAAMGVAEAIPGVSGGTLAFITGIYERLLNAISNINLGLLKTWKEEGFKSVWQKIDGLFLTKLL
ncbi:MAG: putative membrane protein, partial [Bacteroidia bacterium]